MREPKERVITVTIPMEIYRRLEVQKKLTGATIHWQVNKILEKELIINENKKVANP